MKDSLKALLLGSIFLSVFVGGGAGAVAQTTESIKIAPAIIEDKVVPGQVYRFSVTVTNLSDLEKTLYLGAQDITGVDDGGVPIFTEVQEATPYELSSWIALSRSSVTLEAGQSATVPFSVQVPLDASPGSHFGGVFFDSRPTQLQSTGAAVGARVGSIVTLRIEGDIVEEILLREFSTERFVYGAPPVNFTMKIDNLGNVLVRPHGAIEITDMFGKKVGNVEVNASAAAVFPGSDRDYSALWEHDGLAFGRYQALLSVVYGDEFRKTVVRTASFWILPLNILAITLGSLFGGILILYLLVRLYIKKKLNEMGVSSRGSAEMYARRYHGPLSSLTFITVGILLVCAFLLVVLFALFA